MITIQQEEVHLRYANELVKFYWPDGEDMVTVSSTSGRNELMSVHEAADLFELLMDRGAY